MFDVINGNIDRDILNNAEYLIKYFKDNNSFISSSRLTMLLYIMEALYMVISDDEKLYEDDFYKDKYTIQNKTINNVYGVMLKLDNLKGIEYIPEENLKYIREIYNSFGNLSYRSLVDLCNYKGSPLNLLKDESDVIINKSDTKLWFNSCVVFEDKRNNDNNIETNTFKNTGNIDFVGNYKYIKENIMGQDEQIRKILTAIHKNVQLIDLNIDEEIKRKLKSHILVYGSCDSATEILNHISKLYDIPITFENLSDFSEVGYIGRNVDDIIHDLVYAADGYIEKAQNSILVLKYFDQIAERNPDSENSLSRSGVQKSLLKWLDGSIINYDSQENVYDFDTSNLTIIAIGDFYDITSAGVEIDNDYSRVTTNDFIRYGFMPQLMEKFTTLVPMNTYNKNNIKDVFINSKYSPLNNYAKYFEKLGLDVWYSDDFLNYLVDKIESSNANESKLKNIFEKTISDALFDIYAGDYNIIHLQSPKKDGDKPYVLHKLNNISNNKKDL